MRTAPSRSPAAPPRPPAAGPRFADAPPRFAVVGNPDNRRVALFRAALLRAGLPEPRVVPWLDVLRGAAPGFGREEHVRIDSPGEHPEVSRLLRGAIDPARVEGGARWYAAFLTAVRSLRAHRPLFDADELAVLFDKRLCHGVLAAAGVALPYAPTSGPRGERVGGWTQLRALMTAHRLPRVFVKPAHGSSASGVLALETAGPGRVRMTSSVERTSEGLFNSLRVRTLSREREIAEIVDALAPEGLHVERWLPKASQAGRSADLRVVVIAGRATHAVVRTGRGPLTNLHLGGGRGDLERAARQIRAAGGDFGHVRDLAERAAACFPRTLCVGVDVLPSTGWRGFAVGEVNAFGDLLPGLTGLPGSGAEGQDTYAAQIAAVRAGGTRKEARTNALTGN